MTTLPEFRFTPLERFAAVREAGAQALASSPDGRTLIPAEGIIIVYGDGGAGKTTLTIDLTFSLATGTAWLGIANPERPLRIALVENEGPRQEFRQKLDRKLAGRDLAGRVVVLEDPWAELNLADDTHRRALALAMVEHETDLLILGPLVSAGEFPNGGTPTEVKNFEKHVDDLRELVGRPFAIVLVHHENASGRLSGAWARLPDLLLHVTPQGHGRTRVFWQKSRWASEMHGTSTHLIWADGETYTVERRPEVTDDTMRNDVLTAVREHGGASWTKIRDLQTVRGKAIELATTRDRLIADRQLMNLAARDGQFILWHPEDPACPRSHSGTDQERLTFPPPAEVDEADPFPVPRSIGNGGNGNGTAEPELLEDIEWR